MADLNAILDSIKELKLLEVAELVKMMEDEFGVSAAAPVMVAGAADGAAAGGAEKSEFDVVLAEAGASKLGVIKVVRELTGGIYFGERKTGVENGVEFAYDVEKYDENEIRRIGKKAFETAMIRNKKLTCVDKANVLDSSKLWRKVLNELAKDYPEVELSYMYVDNAAMQLVKDPSQFDVIVTNNIFGDIISDEASMITGSIGMLPSASIRGDDFGMYEPIHGSAPDIAGQNVVNPIATILSVAMMLRYSFKLEEEAKAIETAVTNVLNAGYRTKDIYNGVGEVVGTKEMGDLIAKEI